MKQLSLISIISVAICTTSCVDNTYDLSKLDKEVRLFSTFGIEIPLPDNIVADTDTVLNGCAFSGLTENEASESFTAEITVEPLAVNEGSRTIAADGQYKFDFTSLPALFRTRKSEINFDDNTYFTINASSSFSGKTVMSCEIFDALSGEKVGSAQNIAVPSDNSGIKLPFAQCGMKWIPEQVIIKNIKFTVSDGTKSGTPVNTGSTIISLTKITSSVFPYLPAGSKLAVEVKFEDFFKELGVNVNDLSDAFDTKSFQLNGTVKCNVPAILEVIMEGDAEGTIAFEGPSETGKSVSLFLDCPGGLNSVKKVTASAALTAKDQLDLVNVSNYSASFEFKSIKFNGITINPK